MANETEIKVKLDTTDADKSLKDLEKKSDKTNENIQDDFKDTGNEAEKNLDKAAEGAGKAFKTMGTAVAGAMAAAGAAVLALGGTIVSLAGDFSKLNKTLGALDQYGSAGTEALKQFEGFGTGIGLSLDQSREAAVKLMSAFDPGSAVEAFKIIGDIGKSSALSADGMAGLTDLIVEFGNKTSLAQGDIEAFAKQSGISMSSLMREIGDSTGKTAKELDKMVADGGLSIEALVDAARGVTSGAGGAGAAALAQAATDPAVKIQELANLWQQFREQTAQALFSEENMAIFGQVVDALAASLPGAIETTVGALQGLIDAMKWIDDNSTPLIAAFGAMAAVLVGAYLPALISIAAAAWAALVPQLLLIGPIVLMVLAVGAAVFLLVKYWDEIKEAIGDSWEWIKGIWEKVKTFFTDATDWFSSIGSDMMQGLIDGIMAGIDGVMKTVTGLADKITSVFTGILDIHSPSRVFRVYGTNIVQGLDQGIDSQTRKSTSIQNTANALMSGFGGTIATNDHNARLLAGSGGVSSGDGNSGTNSMGGSIFNFNFNGPSVASTEANLKSEIQNIIPALEVILSQQQLAGR